MAIKTIIFDFGNVVAFFDHGRAIAQLAPYTDLPPAELTLHLYGGPLEDAYERDAISTDEYVRQAIANGRLTCTRERFLAAFVDIFWQNREVCELIPRLKPVYRVILASNTTRAHYDEYSRAFEDTLSHFDHLGTSFAARSRKPEPAFCAHIQQYANAEPSECVFIDDMLTNIESAERFGWKGIVYRPDGTLADKLAALGVTVGTK